MNAHTALLRLVDPERFMLVRLFLDDEEPLRCEIARVRATEWIGEDR